MARYHKDYDRFSESKYYIRNESGVMRVLEELVDSGVDTVKISIHNDLYKYTINAMIVAGFSLYNKTVLEDMTYLVFSK